MNAAPILIVPACERGRGGGHLSRSLLLLRHLAEKGRDAYLWIPAHIKDDFLERFKEFFRALDRPRFISDEGELKNHAWDFIVLDRFRTEAGEFAFWSSFAPLIGIDEGGPCRSRFDFLLDLLPSFSKPGANLFSPGLLPLPKNRRSREAETVCSPSRVAPLRILISFGTEDEAALGFSAARALSVVAVKTGTWPELTLIAPIPPHDSFEKQGGLSGVKVVGKIPNLRERLAEFDLFITHFGLGAFEAVYARLPVLLISPTAYHEKLSRNAGFFTLGRGLEGIRRLRRLEVYSGEFIEAAKNNGREIARRFGLEEEQKEDLGSFVCGLELSSPRRCPVCEKGAAAFPVLARTPKESYRRCTACGTIFLARLDSPPIEYKKDYFFDFYKKQYGKTYLEDFSNLKETGRKRLELIKGILKNSHRGTEAQSNQSKQKSGGIGDRGSGINYSAPKSPVPSLLDIGCAYGPFLAAAAEGGFAPFGIDPIEDAVRYVNEELGLSARQGFFPSALGDEFPATLNHEGSFDAVTLWYVIEHFEEPGKMLGEISGLLKEGGVLAFSTPSYSGISGHKSLKAFLKESPPDHRTIWSARSCKRIFRQYGFRLKKIVVTGHHPERFPLLGRFANPAKKGLLYRLLLFASRFFRLGDTFEAYGVKRGASGDGKKS